MYLLVKPISQTLTHTTGRDSEMKLVDSYGIQTYPLIHVSLSETNSQTLTHRIERERFRDEARRVVVGAFSQHFFLARAISWIGL